MLELAELQRQNTGSARGLVAKPILDCGRPLPQNTHVLLCENGDTNRHLVELILKKAGMTVTSVINGQLGFNAIQANPEEFDLVLMDMQMPVLDGYAATTQLREIGYHRPIIALTAHAMRGDQQRCLDAGCTSYVAKPIDITRLLRLISDLLSSDETSRAETHASIAGSNLSRLTGHATASAVGKAPIASTLLSTLPDLEPVIQRFIDQMPEKIQAIQNAINTSNWPEAIRLAHVMAGTGGTVGFDCITEPSRKLEQAAADRDAPTAQHQLLVITSLARRFTGSTTNDVRSRR